ncbi:RNA metabolism [Synechococcus elongatus]|uniref:RNA metabolism n=1 Tax=Synechococcus elongatus PCC 11802 TaxID=2283154 RepID=A0AAT9K2R8_SYNEL|nr:RNA metabolism [Synechococcus elongatus]
MSDQPEELRVSDLLNRQVLDRQTTDEHGRIDRVWMHPPAHRVLGFLCRQGLIRGEFSAFRLDQLHALGDDSVVLEAAPQPANPEKIDRLESLLQHEVWTDAGLHLGKIVDCCFDRQTGYIRSYLVSPHGWRGVAGMLWDFDPTLVLSYGQERVLVAELDPETLPVYDLGLVESVAGAEPDYRQLLGDLRQRARHWKQELKLQVSKAKEQAQQVLTQVQEVREQAQQPLDWDEPQPTPLADLSDSSEDWDAVDTALQPLPELRPKSAAIAPPVEPLIPPEALDDDDPWV